MEEKKIKDNKKKPLQQGKAGKLSDHPIMEAILKGRFKAVIYDMDGTLIDSMWMWGQIDREYLGKHQLEVPMDLQKKIEGISFRQVADYFKANFPIEDSVEKMMQDWIDMAWDKYEHEVPLKAGAGRFLAYCKSQGIRQGIATSNSSQLAQLILNTHHISEYFQTVKTSCEVPNGKPDPAIYLLAAKELGVLPKDCLVFEDSISGILAGKRAGMTVCAIFDEAAKKDEEEKKRLADFYINSFDEIIGLENGFLPVSREDMLARGWDQVDFAYVIGDAYVDHHSFGPAVISRTLEAHGYKVGIISQPDWKDESSIQVFGKPRLGFIICAGNMDSMVNHYTAAKKRRHEDSYTPGGVIGKRPDRATIVYGNLIRRVYRDLPIIIGGIEASLRRLAHYDYWSDKVRRSILIESGADIISYGMGEKSIVELADALANGTPVREITWIRGTVYRSQKPYFLEEEPEEVSEEIRDASITADIKTSGANIKYELLPAFSEIEKPDKESRLRYANSFLLQYQNTDPFTAKILVEKYGEKEYVVQNPPSYPLTQEEMDQVYEYPYMRTYHPMYEAEGGIPAIKELKFSLTSCRGCFGACSFCALTFHQGRIIQARSHESIVKEAKLMIKDPEFKGYINDVGGPTANFRYPACKAQLERGACKNRQCLDPKPCKNVIADHRDYLELLRKLRKLPGVKKVFVRSGIRFDYVLLDSSPAFLKELCEYHVSGQLKVAPEHVSDRVLRQMGKPENSVYEQFKNRYQKMNEQLGKKQYLVPYLMSSHPGSDLSEAIKLAEYVRDLGYMPEQVQDFYPTPSTLSTCMYYTGYNPVMKEWVYVPKTPHEKELQRALIQYRNPKNRKLILEALKLAGREDLIGNDKKCLIRAENVAMIRNDGVKKKERSGGKKNTGQTYSSGQKADKSESRQGLKKKKTIRHVHKKKG